MNLSTPTTSEFSLPQNYTSNKKGPLRWIFSHGVRHWWLVLIAMIGAFGNAALMSISPILIGESMNIITSPPVDIIKIGRYALILALSQLVRGILQAGRNFSFEIIAQRMERDVRNELYTSLLGKSMTFHSLQSVGDIMARATNDVRQINLMFSPGINMVLGSLNFLIMPFVLAPTYHPSLILTPAIYIVLYVLALWHYLRTLNPITREVRESFGVLNTRLSESLDGIETVKGSAQEDSEIALFRRNIFRYRDAAVRQGDLEAFYLPMLLFYIATAGGLFHAIYLFSLGQLNVGQIVGYFGVLGMLGFPTFVSRFAYSRISLGIAGARRILELINTKTELDQNLQGYSEKMQGDIDFENVSLYYNNTDPALQDISFKAKAGQTIAVVGQTGSGKTSLAKLINRTYDVSGGKVTIDGVDVRNWNLESLRRNISIIEQDVFLFSRSISENISFGKQDATREDVEDAAKAAQAYDFIMEFEDTYDSVVGERGMTLSGGQRQRIALARAFLTNPHILILDDSTSAIDSETEDKIQQAIYTASKGRTTIIITHRLSQIRWADLILVMHKGKLIATGTHEELMKTSEAYQRIFSD